MNYELKRVSVRCYLKEEAPYYATDAIHGPDDAIRVVSDDVKSLSQEQVVVISLNAKCIPINATVVSIGSVDRASVLPRDVFTAALLSNAHSILLLHNHPSGDSTPSRTDEEVTKRLVEIGRLLGVPIRDHIIAGDAPFSMAKHSLGGL